MCEITPQFFILDNTMYNVNQIVSLTLDGGEKGHGCWGKIQLIGMKEPIAIGDGSYLNDSRHHAHMIAGEFDFKTLRAIMSAHGHSKEVSKK